MHAGCASSLVPPGVRGAPGWGHLPHPAARSVRRCWWADGQPRAGRLPRLAVQAALMLARLPALDPTSDISGPEFPPIALVAVTWLVHPPSVRWDPQRDHDDVMPRGAVRRRTPYTPGDARVLPVAHLAVRCHAAAHSAARSAGSLHAARLAWKLVAVPPCVARTGRRAASVC